MTCTILEKEDCEKLNMGMYLGVTAASDLPPKFIHLIYKPEDVSESTPKIGLVGKGLTFDSGGYNIKAGAGCMIELMKFDMGGSAAGKPLDAETCFLIHTFWLSLLFYSPLSLCKYISFSKKKKATLFVEKRHAFESW